ncbi:ABC transporter substrate-binding protein [Pyxidicoccus fallax]|uniref:ABC transporter substrate-binding protein n=1 Tax=Pyxidicoccus fallax TaxID=394095 RepID=A0A848LBW3_9BACT|nr:ABC transporter substrate-binding protein [Pyxidicoccus fallax]NMO14315.1 ABC transporter substrate-binding protein [Pyxidicoccus fallax]NPC82419.1 ABC transporter substrate-binding protein [Pyxidicoccus fallax]
MSRLVPLLAAVVLGALACERKAPPAAPAAQPSAAQPRTASETGPIVIGTLGSLTGSEASFGTVVRDGIQFAVEEVNAKGGVKGRKIELRSYDTQGRIEESVAAAQRLLTQDRVMLVLGDVTSSGSLAIADAVQAARVPMVTPSATHPDVTKKGDYIFRTCFIDPFQGGAMARFARENLKLDTVAVLHDARNASSLGLSEAFQEAFKKLGGKVVAVEAYSKGDTDYRAPLLAAKKAKPQALYLPGFYSEVGVIARQARELGMTQPLLGGDGWESDRIFELAGGALEGAHYSSHYAEDNPAPELQRFITAFRARYGRSPEAASALGYDGARVALAAMERAESLSGPAIRDALAATKDFPGATGTLSMDANRNPVKPAVILTIRDGKRRFAAAVTP